MPVSLDTGNPDEHSHSWFFLVDQASDKCSEAVALLLAPTTDSPAGYNYCRHVVALAETVDQGGRQKALQVAKSGPRQAIYKHLLSGYKVIVMCMQCMNAQPRLIYRRCLRVNQHSWLSSLYAG